MTPDETLHKKSSPAARKGGHYLSGKISYTPTWDEKSLAYKNNQINLYFAPEFLISNLSVITSGAWGGGVLFRELRFDLLCNVIFTRRRDRGRHYWKPSFRSALTIHGARLQFHLRRWEGHLTSSKGLFKVSPNLLWNAQWIGANSRSTPSPPLAPGLPAIPRAEEVKRHDPLQTHCSAPPRQLWALLKCKPQERRGWKLVFYSGPRAHRGEKNNHQKVISAEWFTKRGGAKVKLAQFKYWEEGILNMTH